MTSTPTPAPAIPLLIALILTVSGCHATSAKQWSVFIPADAVRSARENAATHDWARAIQQRIVDEARPWMAMTDEQLWGLMFGPTLTRSWMVWSNGWCPSCRKPVPMYQWKCDALKEPWKMWCPHCQERFPKNDFGAFYHSGLDAHGVFDPKLADRSLLYNAEHPDPDDPLRSFGVDDGNGYVDAEGHRWRFIGAYLCYGQWRQAVMGGINKLAAAYVVTGEQAYAHKAGILLDRVADLYPGFDFAAQAYSYEVPAPPGYVTICHDACEDARELALAYDYIFNGIKGDAELVSFLSRKAAQHGLENPKTNFAKIQRNIEDRILRDSIANTAKIGSNYPRTEIAVIVMNTILGWPGNRDAMMEQIGRMVANATRVDGVTGEKGLANYSAFVIAAMADFLAQYSRIDEGFLPRLMQERPTLRDTYRFHLDTWVMRRYYPTSGDTGYFAGPFPAYVGVFWRKDGSLEPSMFSFLWQLYEVTGDAGYVQALYHANGSSTEDLPHDIFASDPAQFQRQVAEVVAQEGAAPDRGSVNKRQWHIALLRSGKGGNERVAWLDYDSGGGHGDQDGMNLGLFAKGLDLMPDPGYPPVQYGGWGSPKAVWYDRPASHNTVVVDREGQRGEAGKTTLWGIGEQFRVIRASAPEIVRASQYERTVALVDTSEADSYVLDIFRVAGGREHAKFFHSHFGTITTEGLKLEPTSLEGLPAEMRNFQRDVSPLPGWSAQWQIQNRHRLVLPTSDIGLRYTDLTQGAEVCACEGWVSVGNVGETTQEAWIPRLIIRRSDETDTLASTFVALIEPFQSSPVIASVRRLPLTDTRGAACPDSFVAVEVALADGRKDLLIAADAEDPYGRATGLRGGVVQPDWGVSFDGQLCWIRIRPDGSVERLAAGFARALEMESLRVRLRREAEFVEIATSADGARVVAGEADAVERVRRGVQELLRP